MEKIGFVASIALLSFLYGFGAHLFGWFPSTFLDRALIQGDRALSPPDFVVPRVHDREGARMLDPERFQAGLTLVSKHWRDFGWQPGVRLIAADGAVVHEWRVDPERLFGGAASAESRQTPRGLSTRGVHGVHLFPNGDLLFNLGYVGTVRLDACGKVLWSIVEGNHHSIEQADDGSFWVPGASSDVRTASSAYPEGHPGLTGPVYHDRILRVSGEGEVLDRIDVLDLIYANGLERHLVKASQLSVPDVTHLNDVEPLGDRMADTYPMFEAGDLLVSLRNLHLVFVVDPDTRRVKWHASLPFLRQHDPDFVGGGWVGVFDNNADGTQRGTMLGGSRIVALQPHTDSTRVLYRASGSETFYSEILGNWQKLENGNLLLTEGRAGRILEVTPGGRTVWEWIAEPYDSSHVTEVTEGTRYSLTPEDVRTWSCPVVADRPDPTHSVGSTRSADGDSSMNLMPCHAPPVP